MASAYKRASHMDKYMSDDSDSNSESSTTVQGDGSEDDSNTSENEAADKPAKSTLQQLPAELRNRVLMLTSRGVSFR